jgi:ABC-type thiamine transport system substrate-binding protein
MPAGGFQEMPPFLLLPEVTEPKNWRPGELMYTSDKGKFILLHDLNVANDIYVNRSLLPASEFNNAQQLIDPKLKGKITMRSPSGEHSGSLTLTGFMHTYGEDFVRKLLTDQQPTFIDDAALSSDAIMRGRAAIVIGSAPELIEQCWREGGCKQVERIDQPRYALGRGVAVFKNAPHPNAAKVFVNWLMSKEGQQKFVDTWGKLNTDGAHSMRVDVEPIHKESAPDYSNLKQYTLQGTDFGKPLMEKVLAMYKEIRR